MRSVQNSVNFNSVQSIHSLPLNLNTVCVGGAYPAIIGRQYTLDRLYSHSHLFNSTQFNLHSAKSQQQSAQGAWMQGCKDSLQMRLVLTDTFRMAVSGSSTNRRVGGFFSLHTKVSLGKILNPELLQMHSSVNACEWKMYM